MLSAEDRRIASTSVFFSSAPADAVDAIFETARPRRIERGAALFCEGEPAAHFFVVLSGWVKLFRISPHGSEAVVGVFTKGQSFAEGAALQRAVYPVGAEAVTDCRVLQVRAATVLDLMRTHQELCCAMLATTFKHLHRLVGEIEQLKAQNGTQRVAEFLLDLCPVDDGACTVTLPYEKVLIAGRLGLKPESLSRIFTRLRESGVTVSQNRAVIGDVAQLRARLQEDPAAAWSRQQCATG